MHRRSSWTAQQNVVSTLVGACCAGGAGNQAPLGQSPHVGEGILEEAHRETEAIPAALEKGLGPRSLASDTSQGAVGHQGTG